MTINKEKLKELAEAANAVTTDVNITMAVGADPEEVKAVQDYLQQTMPKTILALLAEIEMLSAQRLMHLRLNLSLRARRKVWVAHCENAEDQLLDVQSGRDQLKAENEALRKDAQRYRWLRDKQTFIWLIQDWFPSDAAFTDVDGEISAAMAKEP